MGVGEAYKAALHILNSRAYERLACWKASVCFASSTPIFAVHEEFFSQLGKYYQKRSRIFVNEHHPVWDPARGKRPSKKFGKLIRSEYQSIGKMMWEHREEVESFLMESVDLTRYPPKVRVKEERERESPLKREKVEGSEMGDTIMVASAS